MSDKVERRSYFRIDDRVGLSYSILADGEVPETENASESVKALLKELQAIDIDFNRAVNTVWQSHPSIAQALGLLNKKVDLIAQHCPATDDPMPEPFEECEVNISGSGLAFHTSEQLPLDANIWVDIVLQPSLAHLQFSATVVECTKVQEMPQVLYLLRLKIGPDNEAVREQLVQHVVQKQGIQRIESKQQAEQS